MTTGQSGARRNRRTRCVPSPYSRQVAAAADGDIVDLLAMFLPHVRYRLRARESQAAGRKCRNSA
jgi:hypothetical protein